ncbi:NADPH--quinone reductase [Corynebacterium atypicum]|uniref:NADPH--quinone reductase n=1 Tax=Corynebacterium atypicum TaxID=191610 RepID=A0ABN4DCY8_9CORY|nr:quinone oxidoreductase [Corynebacterium atypicum]AIG64097.1 NADPH--quinone reductase [Corynebacterium atypicum]
MKAIQITRNGGPEVMEYGEVESPRPAAGQVLIDVDMAGVNYIDTYYREGIYRCALPFIPGSEGTGRVIEDPAGTIAPGTAVAWCNGPGSYAEQVVVDAERLVAVPAEIDPAVAATMLLQGMTAHYLINSIAALHEGDSCMITAGAGGVGLLATQLAASRGIRVFSVVSSAEKEKLAYAAGADTVMGYSDNLAETVRRHNGGRGVDVVFDGVGRDTFHESLEAVRPRGTVCLFGAASGPVEPFDPQLLNTHGSIFLTRPSLGAYTSDTDEFRMRAQAVTQAITDGTLNVRIGGVYPLNEAAQAHRDLQERKTTGSLVLDVSGRRGEAGLS